MGFLNLGGGGGGVDAAGVVAAVQAAADAGDLALGVTKFADLEDVQVDTALDGSAPRYDQEAQIWIAGPGSDLAARAFKGAWQDPANTLLWSTDFTDAADLNLVTLTNAIGVGGAPTKGRVSTAASGTGTPPAHTFCAQFGWASPTSTTGDAYASIDLNAVAALTGKFVSQVKLYAAGSTTSSGAATHSQGIGVNHSANVVLSTGLVVFPWSEVTVPVGTPSTPILDLALYMDRTTGSLGGATYNTFITGVRVFGAVDNADLYQRDDVVVHDSAFWRSLYDFNSDEPGATAKWAEVPPIAA